MLFNQVAENSNNTRILETHLMEKTTMFYSDRFSMAFRKCTKHNSLCKHFCFRC